MSTDTEKMPEPIPGLTRDLADRFSEVLRKYKDVATEVLGLAEEAIEIVSLSPERDVAQRAREALGSLSAAVTFVAAGITTQGLAIRSYAEDEPDHVRIEAAERAHLAQGLGEMILAGRPVEEV